MTASPPPNPLAPIDDFFVSAVNALQVPGMTLSVLHKGERLIHRGAGVRRLDRPTDDPTNAMDVDSLAMVCSLTKAMTAAAVGILVHRGKLDWTTPVVAYLPEFALSDPEATKRVTLVDLLAHRTGVVGDEDFLWIGDRGDMLAIASLLKIAPHMPFGGPFRSSSYYSNFMAAVAALVVERVSGQSIADFVDENILRPLNMRDGVWSMDEFYAHPKSVRLHDVVHPRTDPAEFAADVAYNKDAPINAMYAQPESAVVDGLEEARALPIRQRVMPMYGSHYRDYVGIGFYCSTANDMIKWGQCWASGGKSASGQQVLFELDTLTKLHNPTGGMYESEADGAHGLRTLGFACGWIVQQFGEHEVLMHTGGFPGTGCVLVVVPGADIVIYLSGNQTTVDMDEILIQLSLHALLPVHRADVEKVTVASALKQLPKMKAEFVARQGIRLRSLLGETNPFAATAPAPAALPATWPELCGNYYHPAFGTLTILLDAMAGDDNDEDAVPALRVIRAPEFNKRLFRVSATSALAKKKFTDPTNAFMTFPGTMLLCFRQVEGEDDTAVQQPPSCSVSKGRVWQPLRRYEVVLMERVTGIELVFPRRD
ncbi:beta-lactamase/transpeptidase-like protein [Blastocladiella britannica]|nr:beta-lactamase/transpeptidase-like protein [Blastocladiella britannica]